MQPMIIELWKCATTWLFWFYLVWVLKRKGQKTFLNFRQLFAFISSAMEAWSKEVFNNTLWGIIYFYVLAKPVVWNYRNLVFPPVFFDSLRILRQPKAKGIRLWQHCLRFKSYIGELLSKFLLWTKCQILLRFCSTDHGHGHGRLTEVKIWNAVSSLALLILEQFKAQLLLISIERKIVRIQQAEFLSDERPTLKTLDFTIRIGSTPTFLYFNLYLNTAFAADYVYFTMWGVEFGIG